MELQFLNLPDHPELVHGATMVSADENGIFFCRMEEDLAKIYDTGERRHIRINCPTGVRIAFATDSPFVALELAYFAEARPIYTMDVIVDGGEIQTYGPGEKSPEFSALIELPGNGLHQIEIHLPHLVEVRLHALAVAAGAAVKPIRCARTILFFGDSITQGMTTSSPARAFAPRLASMLQADFRNVSVGGAVFEDDFGKLALRYPWETVFLAFGANDFVTNVPLDVLDQRVRKILRSLCRRRSARHLMLTPIPLPAKPGKNDNGDTLQDFRDVIAAAAKEFPVQLIDGTTVIPADDRFYADGCHPNDMGAEAMAQHLLPYFQA